MEVSVNRIAVDMQCHLSLQWFGRPIVDFSVAVDLEKHGIEESVVRGLKLELRFEAKVQNLDEDSPVVLRLRICG